MKQVRKLMVPQFTVVSEKDPLYIVVEKVASKESILACVLDKNEKIIGIITPRDLLRVIQAQGFGPGRHPYFAGQELLHFLTSKYAQDIMVAPVYLRPDDGQEKAIEIMLANKFYEVPVVEHGKVLGMINYFNIICSSLEFLKKE